MKVVRNYGELLAAQVARLTAEGVDGETIAHVLTAHVRHVPEGNAGEARCGVCRVAWPCESGLWANRVLDGRTKACRT